MRFIIEANRKALEHLANAEGRRNIAVVDLSIPEWPELTTDNNGYILLIQGNLHPGIIEFVPNGKRLIHAGPTLNSTLQRLNDQYFPPSSGIYNDEYFSVRSEPDSKP